jgi:hypothetical protein
VDFEPNDVSLAQVEPFYVDLPRDDDPKAEVYIDEDLKRRRAVLSFVLYLFGRPVNGNEPLLWEGILSLKKLIAKATLAKLKFSGWEIDARRMLISLPSHKVVGWSASIRALLLEGQASASELHTLVGRLSHVGCIIPMARHFLSGLRQALVLSSQTTIR